MSPEDLKHSEEARGQCVADWTDAPGMNWTRPLNGASGIHQRDHLSQRSNTLQRGGIEGIHRNHHERTVIGSQRGSHPVTEDLVAVTQASEMSGT